MRIDLIKGHGSGNDFFLIDEISNSYSFSEENRAELAKILCNRESGLGADGILFILSGARHDGRMRVFNADGSEASMCGNGLRLVARYILEKYHLNTAVIETMKADLKVSLRPDIYPKVPAFQVEISPVSFQLSDLPLRLEQPRLVNEKISGLSEELLFTALAVPNPHLIALVEEGQLPLQQSLSEKVNGPNKWFPDGVNVSFVKTLSKGNIYVRTFERGVGFTNACGTAMSASSLVTCLQHLNELDNVINVYNNGGMVQCVVHFKEGNYFIDLIGNATYLYTAGIDLNLENRSFSIVDKTDLSEQSDYENLQLEAQTFLKENL